MFRRKKDFYVNARAIIERDGDHGREVLLQVRAKPGQPRTLELPGGQLDPFESIPAALRREVMEETGLTVTAFLDDPHATASSAPGGDVECLTPAFVYQTTRGPVDSVGFFFRVQASGEPLTRGDHAEAPRWVPVRDLRTQMQTCPGDFNWLTLAALRHLFTHTWADA
ncbi:NUDIX domain-containing protein [Deinococcus xianganensis]|uniref:NUDIX domain-containing protein n=1 Tax=Deinococcus xianganensis TaxID=1507289 RepID=A0A6I4Y818_9DEIO|nr:NUDIX hydrolase [Deinococcus xianganensis]MXV18459.1 NUDIX domain-containing protein [Deinococcus xianganensis]